MFRKAFFGLAISALVVSPVLAQDEKKTDMSKEDKAATDMMATVYVYEPMKFKLPSEVIERLTALGYTNIRDFDIEYDEYEVEATTPTGDDVEIEIDPRTGAILEIDENWF